MGISKDIGKREVTIRIDSRIWNRLEEQVKFIRELSIPEMKSIQRVEDIVEFYIEQLSLSDDQLSHKRKQLSSALEEFEGRGVNMRRLLNSFTSSENDGDYDGGVED